MNVYQKLTIAGALILLVIMLFGFSTKPKKLLQEEKVRALNSTSTDINIIKNEVLNQISGEQRASIQIIESQIESAEDTIQKIAFLKDLSGTWFRYGEYALAGSAAKKIAQLEQSGEAWAIAGTTYAKGINQQDVPKKSAYCKENAIESLENAISLNPDNIEYQLNLGILFANYPDSSNPMKGIQILLKLNKIYPKNVPVMNNLAKFALQTNQLDKAEQRLIKAVGLDPENQMANCLSMELYTRLGRLSLAEDFRIKCEQKI